jgi:hypothetical protein
MFAFLIRPVALFVLLAPAISAGQAEAAPKQEAMSPQFREQARQAFHAIERLDQDDRDFHSHHAHQLVNDLLDKIKTPLDKDVHDILFTWLAELELGRTASPAVWRQWMHAEVECQTEAMFYFGGLTEEGKKSAAQKIADTTCVKTAKGLGVR